VHVIAENGVGLLSTALWDIETSAVQRQMQWLVSLPEVGHVRLRAATGPVFEAGKGGYDNIAPAVVLQIPSPRHSGGNSLGTLEIWANTSYFHTQIWTQTAAVVGGYLLITLLICLTAAGVLRRDLQRPLQQIARFAAELKPHNLSLPLTYVRPARGTRTRSTCWCKALRACRRRCAPILSTWTSLCSSARSSSKSL